MNFLIIIFSVAMVITLLWLFRAPIVAWLHRMRSKLRMGSLRLAIGDADKIKTETGRKAIVVFNNDGQQYEALTKKQLKRAADRKKIYGNRSMTKGRTRYKKKTASQSRFTNETIKSIEKRSLYVTK